MTNGELKEALDDYGNHLPVMIVVEKEDGSERRHTAFEVDTLNLNGETHVELRIGI